MVNYLQKVKNRIASIQANQFSFTKAYNAYISKRQKIEKTRHIAEQMNFETFSKTYKSVLTRMISEEIPASYVNSMINAIVESEKLESARQYRAWFKLAQKKYKRTGDERFNIKLEEFKKHGYKIIEQFYNDEQKSFKEVFYS